MALVSDQLETNTFFRTLQMKYPQKFLQAQKKNWIICVPYQKSLNGVYLSETVIDNHILKPSPYFKSHYVSTDAQERDSFEIEDKVIRLSQGKGEVKILMEEKGYNEDYKPYRILIIDHVLNKLPLNKKDHCTKGCDYLGDSSFIRELDYHKLLQSCPEQLNLLDKKINQFRTSYMVLPEYLHDVSSKLRSLVEWATEIFTLPYVRNSKDSNSMSKLIISLESYILSKTHNKIYPVIRKLFAEEDRETSSKLFALHEKCLTPDQLGVVDHFCCHTPSAVVELASLNLKTTPVEKLNCLITTLELLNQDIEKSLHDSYSPANHSKDIPCISSDDLIPLLIYLLVQTRPLHLASNLYYVRNFNWHFSAMDKASFSLVTFQATIEYICNNAFNLIKLPKRKVQNQITLEELIQIKVKVQRKTDLKTSKKQQSIPSTIDNELETITTMIE